jgi:hypothetical protein
MTVRVEDFEIIVGNKAKNFLGSSVSPEWSGEGWIPGMVEKGIWTLRKDGLYHNPDGEELKLTISPEDVEALLSIREYWEGRTISTTADAWQPDVDRAFAQLGDAWPEFDGFVHAIGYAPREAIAGDFLAGFQCQGACGTSSAGDDAVEVTVNHFCFAGDEQAADVEFPAKLFGGVMLGILRMDRVSDFH